MNYVCKDNSGVVRINLIMREVYGQLWSCPYGDVGSSSRTALELSAQNVIR